MTLFWGLPMAGSYCFTRGGAMQVRGRTSSWPYPYPGWPSSKCPGCALPQFQLLLSLTRSLSSAAPRCPHPLCNLKGNKYKLYKVKGGPTLPWGGAAGRRRGPPAVQALVYCCRLPHIIPSCSSVLAYAMGLTLG